MADKIVLIDGHSILNRAYYGIPELTNSVGLHTNAVYGFLNIMFKILDEEQPKYLAVAFDLKAPTFRHKMYSEYKGTRKPMPDELREQVPVIREVLKAMNITVMEQEGLEADDILGTMAKKAQNEGFLVSLISGDRDLLQIADNHIKIRIPKTRPGKTEIEDYYPDDVKSKYAVTPLQFIELKALMGDTADNIPGVPKIGEKTATALMTEYGSLEGIYQNIDNITKKSVRESLATNRDLADLSLKLATIKTDANLPYSIQETVIGDLFNETSYALFKQLEFKNFYGKFKLNKGTDGIKSVSANTEVISDQKSYRQLLAKLAKENRIGVSLYSDPDAIEENISDDGQYCLPGLDTITTGKKHVFFLGLASEHCHYLVIGSAELILCNIVRDLIDLSINQGVILISFDLKQMFHFANQSFRKKAEQITEHFCDLCIGAYLLNPNHSEYQTEYLSNEYLQKEYTGYEEVFGKKTYAEAYRESKDAFLQIVNNEAETYLLLWKEIENRLKNEEMYDLFRHIEMPLVVVLYEMEKTGVAVRLEELQKFSSVLGCQIAELEEQIYQEADSKFNINSPKQLGELLFTQMKIPGGKKTKTGYSTSAEVLEKLALEYPFVQKILQYRALTKLKSTYADGLATCIAKDGRIHTSYNQTITATGRLSSTEPNLQNIPMRTELGRQFRRVFVAGEGNSFVDADYSQIELRLLAHMADDKQLLEAYRSCEDIHKITASKVFHVPLESVTPELRRNAKAVNFGIVYGISSFGLGRDLDITKKEAAKYIDDYFVTYPDIKKFLDQSVASAKDCGYSITLFGRKRPIPELSSSLFNVRSFGERIAMNAPIQGTAADIMKIAMIAVRDAFIDFGDNVRLLLQVHDELVVECKNELVDKVTELLTDCMENCVSLNVNLETDCHSGDNWYDAK